jgi:RNA polymerase sigma-54 factor
MRIGPSLILASRQTLAMTPQLQQAIKLLQFSHLELAAFIQQELEKNPLLQEGPSEDGPVVELETAPIAAPVDTAEALAAAAPPWPTPRADARDSDRGATARQAASVAVTTRPRALTSWPSGRYRSPSTCWRLNLFSPIPASGVSPSLAELLEWVMSARGNDDADALEVGADAVNEVWTRLRQVEPAGLFARSLAECLGAQLAERNRLDPAMKALLDNLDLVAAGELAQLRRRCGVDDEDLRDMLAELRTLDPRPGQKFDFEPIQPVAPDLFLTLAKDSDTGEEGWHIELNTDALPKVLVDRNYHATLMKGARAQARSVSSPSASSR